MPLLYGRLPAWRPLSVGVDDGPDVRQLERNLVALGHDPDRDITVDDHFTRATRAAVRRWQEAAGLEETGSSSRATPSGSPARSGWGPWMRPSATRPARARPYWRSPPPPGRSPSPWTPAALFAEGQVEVAGGGLRAGDLVVVPA